MGAFDNILGKRQNTSNVFVSNLLKTSSLVILNTKNLFYFNPFTSHANSSNSAANKDKYYVKNIDK